MTTLKTFAALVAVLITTSTGYAQQQLPNLKGKRVCFSGITGKLRNDAEVLVKKLGADSANFAQGLYEGDCHGVSIPPYWRIGITQPIQRDSSSLGVSLSGPAGSGSGNDSGPWIEVQASATFVASNGHYEGFGFFAPAQQAGSSSNSSSTGSVSGTLSESKATDQVADRVAKQAVHGLLTNRKNWAPDTDKRVAAMLARVATSTATQATISGLPAVPSSPPASLTMPAILIPPSNADKMREDAAAARNKAAAVEDELQARKELKAAQEKLARAQKVLDEEAKKEAKKKKDEK